jgi:hypothetical protein
MLEAPSAQIARPGDDLQNAPYQHACGFIPPILFWRVKAEMMLALQAGPLRRFPR